MHYEQKININIFLVTANFSVENPIFTSQEDKVHNVSSVNFIEA